MKEVFEHIARKTRDYEQRPIFRHMRDATLPPHQRLRFIPYLSYFVMSFADLYRHVLPEHPPRDRYQELVNTHLSEESSHWGWFLVDLANLELDPPLRLTEALRFLWGDETVESRMLSYAMCQIATGCTSLEKLVVVQAIESTGRVALTSAVHAGGAVNAERSRRKLVYFGTHHLDTEMNHTLEEDDVHASLAAVILEPSMRLRMTALVDTVFDGFTRFADEAYAFSMRSAGPLASAG